MKKNNAIKPEITSLTTKPSEKDGYPVYPASEDIYNKGKLEEDIDPEDISKEKDELNVNNEDELKELDFSDGKFEDDLDIPGSELDDKDELIGSEDEENNSYSIGGDNHNDLEERE